ncbi:MAG: pyruvate kinase [Candidatus Omnitrophica bacterium]|nr:pyruvate kinase [Candidatus Omnitrophota bacterium]
MIQRVRTKIIATLGPASGSETVLRKMFLGGLDIVRLNFSHGEVAEHEKMIGIVRVLNRKMRRAIKIMQDLEGYRLRVGKLAKPVALKKGGTYYIVRNNIVGKGQDIPFDFQGPLNRIKRGMLIYVDDGKIALEVKRVERQRLKVKAMLSGELKERKGINIPGLKMKLGALTEKDKKDLEVGIKYRLDYIAQSFVSNADDIRLLRSIIKPRHAECGIFAKVENREALLNIDDIINEADGIVIARGDLGVCIPLYKVPIAQKEIIKKCRKKNKPVVVATQMLDSMTEERIPTRAEVSDVANAILDGATHLFLSGETAVGKYPNETVDMMNKIIKYTEAYQRRVSGKM